ncbi:hypothetical protein FOA52_008481 [Chlamydomonas sp. UWO 241]|nr:hypothetical protein FOA52_008481 [Chlamydomonas sp. UWO 241]
MSGRGRRPAGRPSGGKQGGPQIPDASGAGMNIAIFFGVAMLLAVGYLFYVHYRKYGNPLFTESLPPKKLGAKKAKREKLSRGMQVLGD